MGAPALLLPLAIQGGFRRVSFYPVPIKVPGRHTPPPPNFEKDVEEAPLSRGEFQKELISETEY
jgi:hypothetical protein